MVFGAKAGKRIAERLEFRTWASAEDRTGKLQFLRDGTDIAGTTGHQREPCRHLHEDANSQKVTVSHLAMVPFGPK